MRTLIARRAQSLAVGTIAGVLLVAGATGAANAADEPLVLDAGHIDAFALTWQDGELAVQLQEDVTGHHVLHAPQDVVLGVKSSAEITLPDPVPASLSFLGSAGDSIYYLPQTQDPDLIWPGWSTEQISSDDFTSPLSIAVTEVQGPGSVYLWQTGSFGQSLSVLGGGYQLPGTIPANVNVHAHANWAFTEAGRYTLTVQASGTLVGGAAVSSVPVTYTFDVGDAPDPDPTGTPTATPTTGEPTPDPVATTVSIAGLADHYHPGDLVTLSAVQEPQTSLDHYHWFTRAPGADSWVIVPSVSTGQYSFTATEEHEDLQVLVRLYDGAHAVVAESAPVTIEVHDHSGEEPHEPAAGTQRIVATLPADAGALVLSIDPEDATVDLGDLELSAAADRWSASGELRPVTVTDTRPGAPGWVVSGQVTDFTSGTNVLSAAGLGWSPVVAAQPAGGSVNPGGVVAPGLPTGAGLSVSSTLASASAGGGTGTSRLGAGLVLAAPTTLPPGTYTATLTFTAI